MRIIFITFILILEFFTLALPQVITEESVKKRIQDIEKKDFATIENAVGLDSFYDPNIDYTKFSGRMTDKDETATLIKISTESKNIKFLKPADPVTFKIVKYQDRESCHANVRSVEEGYITIYVKNLFRCWDDIGNFRRGTILVLESKRLQERIKVASRYRVSLLNKKRDFLFQLNEVNKFVWGFNQELVKVAAKYDREIVEIQKKKEEAMNLMLAKKRDQIRIQKELAYRLDELDKDLKYYRVEKDEVYTDRWHLDKDVGVPTYERPVPIKTQ